MRKVYTYIIKIVNEFKVIVQIHIHSIAISIRDIKIVD